MPCNWCPAALYRVGLAAEYLPYPPGGRKVQGSPSPRQWRNFGFAQRLSPQHPSRGRARGGVGIFRRFARPLDRLLRATSAPAHAHSTAGQGAPPQTSPAPALPCSHRACCCEKQPPNKAQPATTDQATQASSNKPHKHKQKHL